MEMEPGSNWSKLAGSGVEFGVAVAMFALLGHWLDGRLGTSPWLLIGGCALGFSVGLFVLIRAARKMFHD